ncbi:cytochrome c oxidase subunit 6a, mitochondrial-like isoform X2 [Tripterygium wilfordii]|uniref:cytochrome c oxidase subunit 6a, mitochondrial-like isoform X2 n=1 Tax=Tripterygium wilfordii TaxID=458696 RepID=UPI0018F80741|nr:cytochrome c oxidase subunit 6a, mitochondrial-like isoform X2 [Tripterygium wilfordii]
MEGGSPWDCLHPAFHFRSILDWVHWTLKAHLLNFHCLENDNRSEAKGFTFQIKAQKMAMSTVRSAFLRNALRGGSRTSVLPKRRFSSSAHHDDAYESAKWEKITYLGIATCTILTIYNLSKGHPHYEKPPVPMVSSRRNTTRIVGPAH